MEKANRNPNPFRIIELDNPDLPIICPNTEAPGLLMHPRVYLKITSDGTCRCPYCSTLYIIRSFSV